MAALQTPSPTLFISNIEGKTKKPGKPLRSRLEVEKLTRVELRSALYALFNPYGQMHVQVIISIG